jgi:hypothetical protein
MADKIFDQVVITPHPRVISAEAARGGVRHRERRDRIHLLGAPVIHSPSAKPNDSMIDATPTSSSKLPS